MVLESFFDKICRSCAYSEVGDLLLVRVVVLKHQLLTLASQDCLVTIWFCFCVLVWVEDVPAMMAEFEHVGVVAGAVLLNCFEAV